MSAAQESPLSRDLPPWADPARTHLNNFDFIRLLLAVLVIYSHSSPLIDPKRFAEPCVFPGYSFGGFAVDGFFIISGYLITQSWLARPRLGTFLRKRISRIYPGFIAMMLALALVMVPIVHEGPKAMWRGLRIQEWVLTTITLGPYIRPDCLTRAAQTAILNGSTWTIRFEFLCYLLLAVGMLVGILRNRWLALAVFVLGMFGWDRLISINWIGREFDCRWLVPALTPLGIRWDGHVNFQTAQLGIIGGVRFAMTFLAGSVFFHFRSHIPHRWFIAIPIAGAWLYAGRSWNHALAPFLAAAIFLPYLLLYVAYLPIPHLHRFARFGDFSYGTYLYAWPAQQLLVLAIPTLTPLSLFALATPIAIGMGALSWHGVEKHFLRRRHKPKGDA